MISEERLQGLERLASEATPGPWYQCKDKVCDRGPWYECRDTDCYVFPINIARNAQFIAAAREAVPELIARVRQLEKEADWLAEQCQTMSCYSPTLRQGSSKKQWREEARKEVGNDK